MRVVLLLAVLSSLPGCQRWESPWTEIGSHPVKGPWPGYGLPVAGGTVKRADDRVIIVRLPAATQAERQAMYSRWESTLAQRHRRTERAGDLITSGFRSTGFHARDGAHYVLTGERQGDAVLLSVRRIPR